ACYPMPRSIGAHHPEWPVVGAFRGPWPSGGPGLDKARLGSPLRLRGRDRGTGRTTRHSARPGERLVTPLDGNPKNRGRCMLAKAFEKALLVDHFSNSLPSHVQPTPGSSKELRP